MTAYMDGFLSPQQHLHLCFPSDVHRLEATGNIEGTKAMANFSKRQKSQMRHRKSITSRQQNQVGIFSSYLQAEGEKVLSSAAFHDF